MDTFKAYAMLLLRLRHVQRDIVGGVAGHCCRWYVMRREPLAACCRYCGYTRRHIHCAHYFTVTARHNFSIRYVDAMASLLRLRREHCR